jgi:hypothetical protein
VPSKPYCLAGRGGEYNLQTTSQRMQSLLRDLLLSYCPAAVRRSLLPASALTVLRTAVWSGLAQFMLAGLLFLVRLKAYFVLRAHQMAPQLAGANDAVQAGATVVVALEYLIHPLAFFLLYLTIEGFIRFMGGLIAGEIVPSLLVYSGFRAADSLSRLRERRRAVPLLLDTLDHLPDGCIRIAASAAKPGWNASVTIGIDGRWMELEREEHGPVPRSFVYILRPASPGKILRGYQEYDATSALSTSAAKEQDKNADAS